MSTIKSLYSEIQKNEILQDRISGDLTLQGKAIIWSYKIENDINYDEDSEFDEIDENDFNMADSVSIEELLNNIYDEDLEEIHDNLSENAMYDSLEFSQPKVKGNSISFKITIA